VVYCQSVCFGPKFLRPTTSIFFFQLNTCDYSPHVTSSLTRGWVCRLQLLLVVSSAVILGSESHRTHDHILPSQIWDFPNLEGQVPTFISPRNRLAQLYPQALRSLFVALYNSQGFGGGIWTHRVNNVWTELFPSNSCYIVTCLHNCYLAMCLHVTLLQL
jgi:hypothetical protein